VCSKLMPVCIFCLKSQIREMAKVTYVEVAKVQLAYDSEHEACHMYQEHFSHRSIPY
jgi:hypothetical protein